MPNHFDKKQVKIAKIKLEIYTSVGMTNLHKNCKIAKCVAKICCKSLKNEKC